MLGGSSRTQHWRPKASLGPAPHSGDNGAASLVSRGAPWGKGWGPGAQSEKGQLEPWTELLSGDRPWRQLPPAPVTPTSTGIPPREPGRMPPRWGSGAPHTSTQRAPQQGRQCGSPLADVAAEREGPESPGQSLGLRPHEGRPRGPASPRGGCALGKVSGWGRSHPRLQRENGAGGGWAKGVVLRPHSSPCLERAGGI